MEKYIENILKYNENILGLNPKIEKINVGFTNTVYNVDDRFIIKICTNLNNEASFQNEINFYRENSTNSLIPHLFYANTAKDHSPYYYEIIEKIPGVSLYHVWHTFTEEEREEVIKKLCHFLKQIHQITASKYDWTKKFEIEFTNLYQEANSLKIFTENEQKLLENAFINFSNYLPSDKFVLVHNDLHFDNIFYHNQQIKIIDFERSLFAPIDYELAILYRMIDKPWKFASEETEKFTNRKDYSKIKTYLERYYPEIVSVPHLQERLAIYDLVYNLSHLIKYPNLEELKKSVILAAKTLTQKVN